MPTSIRRRPFLGPEFGRIAAEAINYRADELKVRRIAAARS
jgi:hypothetical protein